MAVATQRHTIITGMAALDRWRVLNTLNGRVLETCIPQRRYQEWLRFLPHMTLQTPANRDPYLSGFTTMSLS